MTAERSIESRYRVNGLLIDLGTCEVRHGNKVVALPKLSFDLLASLIRNAPNVVTMDELIDEVWGGRIVAEVIIGLLRADSMSILNQEFISPLTDTKNYTMADMIHHAGWHKARPAN